MTTPLVSLLSSSVSRNEKSDPCQVCSKVAFRYRCPKCGWKTCSLKCCTLHKENSGCDGKSSRTKFVSISEFTDENLMQDFNFLEDVSRMVGLSRRDRLVNHSGTSSSARVSAHRGGRGGIRDKSGVRRTIPISKRAMRMDRLKKMCKIRNTWLRVMPDIMLRSKANKSHYSIKDKRIYWSILWSFPAAQDPESKEVFGLLEHAISELNTWADALKRLFLNRVSSDRDQRLYSRLEFYANQFQKFELENFKLFIPNVNGSDGKKTYHQLRLDMSIQESLQFVALNEHPDVIVEISGYESLRSYPLATKIISSGRNMDNRADKNEKVEVSNLSQQGGFGVEINQAGVISTSGSLEISEDDSEHKSNAEDSSMESDSSNSDDSSDESPSTSDDSEESEDSDDENSVEDGEIVG